MRKFIVKKISKTKGYDYKVDSNLSTTDLFKIATKRFFMLFRGFFKRAKLKKVGSSFFVGKKVKIDFGKRIRLGNTITLNDNSSINALSKGGIIIGDNFNLGSNSYIDCTGVISELGEALVIGNNVGISCGFTLFVRGKVEIGDDVIIGPNVSIIAENHNHADLNAPIHLQGTTRKGIKIENNCWIGAGAVILDGVTIGKNAIVAAGAVVNRDVMPNTIVGGVPAKFIKYRDDYENING